MYLFYQKTKTSIFKLVTTTDINVVKRYTVHDHLFGLSKNRTQKRISWDYLTA